MYDLLVIQLEKLFVCECIIVVSLLKCRQHVVNRCQYNRVVKPMSLPAIIRMFQLSGRYSILDSHFV